MGTAALHAFTYIHDHLCMIKAQNMTWIKNYFCGQATLLETLSVRWSVVPPICWSVMIESESGKMRILETFCVRLCVGVGVWMGMDAPAHQSAMIL